MVKEFDRRTILKASTAFALSGASVLTWQATTGGGRARSPSAERARRARCAPPFFGLNGNNIAGTGCAVGPAPTSAPPSTSLRPWGPALSRRNDRELLGRGGSGGFQPNGPWPGQTNWSDRCGDRPDRQLARPPTPSPCGRAHAEAVFVRQRAHRRRTPRHQLPTTRGMIQDQSSHASRPPQLPGIRRQARSSWATSSTSPEPSAGAHGSDYTHPLPHRHRLCPAGESLGQRPPRRASRTATIAAVGTDAAGNNIRPTRRVERGRPRPSLAGRQRADHSTPTFQ